MQTAGGKAPALSLVILSRTVFCSTDDTSSQILSLHSQSRVLSILKIVIFKVDIGKLRAGLRERIVGFFMKYLAAHFVTFFNDSSVICFEKLVLNSLTASPLMKPYFTPGGRHKANCVNKKASVGLLWVLVIIHYIKDI